MNEDVLYMKRCFELAALASGNVSPNPLVGALVVHNGKVISEGYHKQYGCPHAEVNAIDSVEDKSLLKHSTLYVNLEPCCHYGKTPPCTKLIIESQIPKVVIANKDINIKVGGKGIKALQDGGIEVVSGVLEEQGLLLNRRFFCFHQKQRPYIILKWAQTKDGFMDEDRVKSNKSQWITNDILRVWVHKQRTEEGAILVGAKTIINDNPQLNVRYFAGRNPLRITIDNDLTLAKHYNIFDNSQSTLIFNSIKNDQCGKTKYIKLSDSDQIIKQILSYLYLLGINSLIVEGGKKTLNRFIEQNLWDEATVLVGDKSFHQGLLAPVLPKAYSSSKFGSDEIHFYYNN
jgi:diaminohydroxyphosphoribosylaminopyrimidine deaminase/5-amino-6-(5-phosphoribosylamino)uracil reductase